MTIRLGDIVAALGGELQGDPDAQVTSLAPAYRAKAGEMTFLTPQKTAADLAQIQASVVVLPPALAQLGAPKGVSCVITAQPYLYHARLSQWWAARVRPPLASGVHPTAYVAPGSSYLRRCTWGRLSSLSTPPKSARMACWARTVWWARVWCWASTRGWPRTSRWARAVWWARAP